MTTNDRFRVFAPVRRSLLPLYLRLCCKSAKMLCDQFPANRRNEPQSPIGVALRPLPKSPVSSSLDNVVPQSIVRSPRVRPGTFVFGDAKRLFQQNLPIADTLH